MPSNLQEQKATADGIRVDEGPVAYTVGAGEACDVAPVHGPKEISCRSAGAGLILASALLLTGVAIAIALQPPSNSVCERVDSERAAYERNVHKLLEVLQPFIETIQTGIDYSEHARLIEEMRPARRRFENHCTAQSKRSMSYDAFRRTCAALEAAHGGWSMLVSNQRSGVRMDQEDINELTGLWRRGHANAIDFFEIGLASLKNGR